MIVSIILIIIALVASGLGYPKIFGLISINSLLPIFLIAIFIFKKDFFKDNDQLSMIG